MELTDLIGLIPTEVGETLAHYASEVREPNVIVEIGSYKGKSTCYLASRAQVRVYAIDRWDSPGNVNGRFGFAESETRRAFDTQIRAMGYQERITPIQAPGDWVAQDWDMPVGLLFVDGDHSARAVEADVRAWTPHMAPGATVILDDLDTPKNPGVRVAAQRLAKMLGPFTIEAGRLAIWKL